MRIGKRMNHWLRSDDKSENITKIEPVDMNTSNVGTKAIISLLAKIPMTEGIGDIKPLSRAPGTVSNCSLISSS